ncbi:MAG: response regulator [Thermoproteota archaeon]|nr:response regulator [Thermoproteota archaeon]
MPYSILVVDDEVSLANMFRQFLVKLGYDAVSFTNPLLAFEHFKQNHEKYSAIITDLRMPGMSGLELANEIRKDNSLVKVFLVTAFDASDLINLPEYKTARIDQIVKKPIRLPTLKKMLERTLVVKNSQQKRS